MRKKILAFTLAILLFVAVATPTLFARPAEGWTEYCYYMAAKESGLYNQIISFWECYNDGGSESIY